MMRAPLNTRIQSSLCFSSIISCHTDHESVGLWLDTAEGESSVQQFRIFVEDLCSGSLFRIICSGRTVFCTKYQIVAAGTLGQRRSAANAWISATNAESAGTPQKAILDMVGAWCLPPLMAFFMYVSVVGEYAMSENRSSGDTCQGSIYPLR